MRTRDLESGTVKLDRKPFGEVRCHSHFQILSPPLGGVRTELEPVTQGHTALLPLQGQ